MTREQEKASREKQIFLDFIKESCLPIDAASVESRSPSEPDILCRHEEEGFIAFELVELCDQEIAWTNAKAIRSEKGVSDFLWSAPDSFRQKIYKKLKKKYKTEHPIELLCYTDVRICTHDEAVIEIIQEIIGDKGFGPFRRVWLLGDDACKISERALNYPS